MKYSGMDAWELVRIIIAKAYGHECSPNYLQGIPAMRELYEKNKGWMFPFFDEEGHRTINAIDTEVSDDTVQDVISRLLESPYQIEASLSKSASRILRHLRSVSLLATVWREITQPLSIKEIKTNRLAKRLPDPSRPDKLLQVNAKVSKYISLSASVEKFKCIFWNPDELAANDPNILVDAMTSLYSAILAPLSEGGDPVVLSINPVDLLLVSHSTTGWSSCHDVRGNYYANAALNFILDGVSAVAFSYKRTGPLSWLELGNDVVFPVKYWRQMIYFDVKSRSAVVSREYPGENVHCAEITRRIVANVLADYHKAENRNWKRKVPKYEEKGLWGKRSSGSSISFDGACGAVLLSEGGKIPSVTVGTGKVVCPGCGQSGSAYNEYYRGSTGKYELICSQCWNRTCPVCGKKKPGGHVEIDGNRMCYDCAAALQSSHTISNCPICSEKVIRPIGSTEPVVCSRCQREEVRTCRHCHEKHYRFEMVMVAKGHYYCKQCAAKKGKVPVLV